MDRINRDWRNEQRSVNLVDHAKAYIKKGWSLIPLWWVEFPGVCACYKKGECSSAGKHPITAEVGVNAPCKTPLDVELWWARHPMANIGVATGAQSGFVVLDVDPKGGGWDSLHGLMKRHGPIGETYVSVTGSGGRHILFRHPGKPVRNSVGCMPGIDIRGDGGLIVAPPSMHSSGCRYGWHSQGHPARARLLAMPGWMEKSLRSNGEKKKVGAKKNGGWPKPGKVFDLSAVPRFSEGERNDEMCRIVGRLIWESRDLDEVMSLAHKINESRCNPSLPEREVTRLVELAFRRWNTG